MDKLVVTNPLLLASAITTLSRPQKALESKWFYDARGSELFEAITALPEYYPTRTEIKILRSNAHRMASLIPDESALVELGSGASIKTRILLSAFTKLAAYVPLDISETFLRDTAASLRIDFPMFAITPVVADFMIDFRMPEDIGARDLIVFFPGSTIGNLTHTDAVALLKRIRALDGVKAMILGADLVKNPDTLIAAYDDASGVTAAFNRNLLHRLNREVGATFRPKEFDHQARWNADESRIEMHLSSRVAQTVSIASHYFEFESGESIHSENSHKYTREKLMELANRAGWDLTDHITDEAEYFSVNVLVPQ